MGFTQNRVLDYPANRTWFTEAGFSLIEPSDGEFEMAFSSVIRDFADGSNRDSNICIYISSFSRLRIAIIISCLEQAARTLSLSVDFLYSGAEFSAPVDEAGLNISSGPVTDRFAGWSADPDMPPVAIIGLGYERDKAVGAVEYIEPAEVWAFAPADHESEYSEAIKRANEPLLETLNPSRLWPYQL